MAKPRSTRPSKFFSKLLSWFCADQFMEELQGDLEEKFYENLDEFGASYAQRHYRKEVLLLIRPSVIKPKFFMNYINWALLTHAFKASFRNLKKQRAYSILNIIGFASALSICLFCVNAIYSNQLLDQKFEDKELIYRVNTRVSSAAPDRFGTYATSQIPLYEKVRANIPEAEKVAVIQKGAWSFEAFLKGGKHMFTASAVNEDFFDVFNYDILHGDPKSLFGDKNKVVITKEVMDRFYEPETVIGASIGKNTIVAVIETPQKVSHLKFEVLTNDLKDKDSNSFYSDWRVYQLQQLYIKRHKASEDSVVQSKLNTIAQQINQELKDQEDVSRFSYKLEALSEVASSNAFMNFGSLLPAGGQKIVAILMLILLGICTFNYTNLAMASAIARTKEIAVRKVMGSKKSALLLQFLAETVILSLAAFLLGLLFFKWLAPKFATFSDFYFETRLGLEQILIFLLFTLGMAIFSGAIPGIIFSNTSLLQLFKKTRPKSKLGIKHLKKGMITLQLTISLFVFIVGFFLYNQTLLIANQDNPLAKSGYVAIQPPVADSSNLVFKNELYRITGVNTVTSIERMPFIQSTPLYRIVKSHKPEEYNYTSEIIMADTTILELLGESVTWFGNKPEDLNRPFLLANRKFSDQLSDAQFPISEGQYSLGNEEYYPVLGMVENLNGSNQALEPRAAAICVNPNAFPMSYLVQLSSEDFGTTMANIQDLYQEQFTGATFKPYFLDDMLDQSLSQFNNIMNAVLFVLSSIIVITMMGQIGMSMYMAQTKEKEIGIRKVLGANFRQIVNMVLKGTYVQLVIGALISCPLAYLFYSNAVPSFTIPIELGIEHFVLGVATFSLLLLTLITFQTRSTINADPANTLRSE